MMHEMLCLCATCSHAEVMEISPWALPPARHWRTRMLQESSVLVAFIFVFHVVVRTAMGSTVNWGSVTVFESAIHVCFGFAGLDCGGPCLMICV